MSATNEIRAALLAGESFTNKELQARFQVGSTIFSQIRSHMKKQSYTFNKERVDGANFYSIGKLKKTKKQVASPSSLIEPASTPMPALLDQLQVAALAVDRKGRLGMTLRSSKHSWRVDHRRRG